MRKRVYVSSALSGDIPKNRELAVEYCAWTSKQGQASYAPHVLCTIWLDDTVAEERIEGMENGYAFLDACDEMWAFFPCAEAVGQWSRGMTSEFIQFQEDHPDRPVRMFVRLTKMKYEEVFDKSLYPHIN